MDLDIDKIRAIWKRRSSRCCPCEKSFPATLEISLQEQAPIMVLRLKVKSGGYNDWLVSADGALYQREEYSPARLSLLPSLAVPSSSLKRTEDGAGLNL